MPFPYRLSRAGVIMRPEPGNPLQAEGVLNPAVAVGPDGRPYLYPRLVAAGNISRIGRARLTVTDGTPTGVEHCDIVLAPDRTWEHGQDHGGVEDPRITYLNDLGAYVMAYVAFGPLGPHPALALSRDGTDWTRLGPLQFQYDDALDADLNLYPNKDVALFPEPVPGPGGEPCYAILHRPMWEFDFCKPAEPAPLPNGVTDDRAGIWISYVRPGDVARDPGALCRPFGHRVLAMPEQPWESLKIGAGAPPIRVPEGWLLLYHGVAGSIEAGGFSQQQRVRYSAGGMILSGDDPTHVLARSTDPILEPETAEERDGTVPNVVFPTAACAVGAVTYVFYGMADSAIGVAALVSCD